MKKNILNVIAAASAVALAMVPATVNAAGVTYNTTQGSMGANNCEVVIEAYAGARANVMVPSRIVMSGVKKADYTVFAFAQADDLENIDNSISVTPSASFELTRTDGSSTATATVTQDKTTFTKSDVQNGTDDTMKFTIQEAGGGTREETRAIKKSETKGHINANITGGSWKGTLVFTIE